VWRDVKELKLYLAVALWWVVLASTLAWPLSIAERAAAFALVAIAPFAAMTWRKRSVTRAVYSVVSWCFNAAGLLRGFARKRVAPASAIASIVLHEPSQSTQPMKRQRIA
jgi:hypothetical protein